MTSSTTSSAAHLSMSSSQVLRGDEAGPRYRIVRRLYDSSPSATLYLCEELPLRAAAHVVVKVACCSTNAQSGLSPRSPASPVEPRVGGDSIEQEYAVASRLLDADVPHPHVVEYYSVATTTPASPDQSSSKLAENEELVVLVMEYCPRGDLFAELEHQHDRRFPEVQALVYFKQIISGVHHLHTLGIAHLDISLENVLVDAHGHAKICDFGLSVFVDQQRRRCARGRVGKLQYMAPEVVSGEAYDPVCADVWSLGVVLFILLTGSPLFQLATRSDAAWKALERVGVSGILRHWKMESEVSAATVELLERMLQLDASKRVQTLDSVVDALE